MATEPGWRNMKNRQRSLCWAECWKDSFSIIVLGAPRQDLSKLPADPVHRCMLMDLKINIRHRYTPQPKFRALWKLCKETGTLPWSPDRAAQLTEGPSCDWLLADHFSAQEPLIR